MKDIAISKEEVECFTDNLCSFCIHEKAIHQDHIDNKSCAILKRANKGEHPKEWKLGHFRYPECSEHVPWDWGTPDNWNEPTDFDIPYTSKDPNRLTISFE